MRPSQAWADDCEWNPLANRVAYIGDVGHNVPAEILVGAKGEWRLCALCAALPRFRKYTVRAQIHPRTPNAPSQTPPDSPNSQPETNPQ